MQREEGKKIRKEVEEIPSNSWYKSVRGYDTVLTHGKWRLIKAFTHGCAADPGTFGPYYKLLRGNEELVHGYGWFANFSWVARLFRRINRIV